MSTLHRINVLRIKGCSDGQYWYRGHIGQLVPHLGWDAADGFRSREPDGLVNFVRTQDAVPTQVHVGPDMLGHWPFNCGQAPIRKVVHITRRAATTESAASLLRPGLEQRAEVKHSAPAKAGQIRRHSALETAINVAVGLVISYCLTATVLPAFGHQITPSQNVWITTIFTVASVLRSYALRRVFNWIHTKDARP